MTAYLNGLPQVFGSLAVNPSDVRAVSVRIDNAVVILASGQQVECTRKSGYELLDHFLASRKAEREPGI